jgi:tape measure domain-containing protein
MAETAQIKVTADTSQAERALGSLTSALKGIAGIAIGGNIARQFMDIVSSTQELTNKLLSVSSSISEANGKFDILAGTAQKTGSNLGGTVDLFQKLSMSATFTGSSTEALAKVVENFNKTLQISGTSGAGAAASLYQFAQAMSSGTLSGDEFRNQLETNGFLIQRLAANITGGSIPALRQMAEDGRLSAGIVAKVLSEDEQIAAKYAQTVKTIPQAFENLQTSIAKAIKDFDEFTGVGNLMVSVINLLSENIQGILIAALGAAAAAFILLDIAAAPWILAAAAITAGIVLIGIAIQKMINFIKSGINYWDSFVAALDNGVKKLADIFGFQYDLSNKTVEANKKVEESTKKINTAAASGLVINEQRNKQALDLDKALKLQIGTMNESAYYDARITDQNRIQLEIDKAIAIEKEKYKKTGQAILPDLEKQLALAVRAREEAKLSAAGQQFILDNQSQLSKILNDELLKRQEIAMAVKNGADAGKAAIATERLRLQTLAQELAIAQKDPSTTAFDRYTASTRAFMVEVALANKQILDLYASMGKSLPTGSQLVKPNAQGEGGVKVGDAFSYGTKDYFSMILNNEVDYNLEALRITRTMYDSKLAIASDYYAELLTQERNFIGVQTFGSESAKQIATDRANFEKKSDMEKYAFGLDQAAQMYTQLGTYNKQAFEAAKAFNIANAIMNTYMGATKALATYPWPFGMIAAGLAIATGMAQVAQIRSQTYSGKALGGAVNAGQSYIVGEKGPEMFVPAGSGSIVPNSELKGGGQPVNINFTIQANDAQGFDDLLIQRRSMVTQMVRDAMAEQGQRSRM